jgi:hypothetical protein
MKAWPDWDEFVRRLREDPVFREEVRRQVLTEDLLNLPAVVSRVLDLQRQTLEVLRGFMEATDRRFAAAEAQIAENGRQIAALTEALREFREAADRRFAALERDVGTLKDDVRTLQGSVGHLTGRDFESQFRKMAPAVFRGGGDLRSALHRALSAVKVDLLSPEEHLRLRKLDFLWGRGGTVFVGEVSEAVGEDDVFRVRWSVEILRRLGWGRGLRLLPVVVGREVGRVPEAVGWVRFDPDEEVLEISPGIETILREEEPKPVGPGRFFGGGADDSPLRET